VRQEAIDAVRAAQRAEVVALLERARIPQRKNVPGLRDRVSRALAILQLEPEELAEFDARLADADRSLARRSAAAPTLRLVALLAVLAMGVAAAIAGFAEGQVAIAVLAIVGAGLSIAAFIVAVRASVVRQEAIDAVRAAQRAEVVALLERARIPQRKNVPGLRDRVTRALAILREQQK
jgi:hypothetical protein